jgi:hypothetical protein
VENDIRDKFKAASSYLLARTDNKHKSCRKIAEKQKKYGFRNNSQLFHDSRLFSSTNTPPY